VTDPNSTIPREVRYEGFMLQARPLPLREGGWTTEVRISRNNVVVPFTASNMWDTEDQAVIQCLEFGKRVVDGEVPTIGRDALP
jgi:hypothetical protein